MKHSSYHAEKDSHRQIKLVDSLFGIDCLTYVLVKLSPDTYIFSGIFEKDVSISLMGIVSICNHRLVIITLCVCVCVKHPINS